METERGPGTVPEGTNAEHLAARHESRPIEPETDENTVTRGEAAAEEPEATAEAPEPMAEAHETTAEAHETTAEAPEPTAEAPETTAEAPEPTADTTEAIPVASTHTATDVPATDILEDTPAGTASDTSGHVDETAALFSADEADRYLADWRAVQASFVDDPQAAVGRAEALVGDVIDAVTTRISQRRAELSGQRTSTEGERTEQLRQALRGYRALLRQLLPGAEDRPNATVAEPAVRS